MKGKVKCTCGWSWNKSDSSKKDMYICHECGRDNSNNIPKAQTGISSDYIDISKKYGIPQFTEEYIIKAIELNKQYPGSKFVCDANGCADIANQAANAMGHDFGKANAWDYGNRSDILFTNPNYTEELKDPNGPLHNPTSYKVPKEFLGMENVLIGLNRKNNLLNAEGKKVGNVPNAQQLAAATNKQEANDSFDYANQDLYKGSRGYEHIGYMMGNNNLLHGTAANKDHPAFFVIDDISDGVNLSGYGKYEPVEAIAEPTTFQSFTNKLKSLSDKAEKAIFGDPTINKIIPPKTIKKKNGGWLDNYADGGTMQEHQENYNDSQASAPEGMVGDGFSNVGRNYSPAWGGQFQMGGSVYPVNYVPEAQDGYRMGTYFDEDAREREPNMMEETYDDYNTAMTGMMKSKMATQAALGNKGAQRMMSSNPSKYIFTGNERFSDGSRAEGAGAYGTHYMSNRDNYVYPNLQDNGEGILNFIPNASPSDREAMRFESPGEADYFANHYKEVAPMMKSNKMQMGGSLPGATGHFYARYNEGGEIDYPRTKGIPSNGPYAKKTMASAQNGKILNPKEFTLNYINSPKYKERLQKSGYNNINNEIKNRYDSVNSTNTIVEQNGPLGFWKSIIPALTGEIYSQNGGSNAAWENAILLDTKQVKDLGTTKEDVLAHEFSHKETGINRGERLNKKDLSELTKRLNPKANIDEHDSGAHENKADLNALRYELQKQGVDVFNKDITPEHIKQLKKSKNFSSKRAFKNYKDDDLLWLLNNVAKNDTSEQINQAQNGVDMYGAPITAIKTLNPNIDRTSYDPRTNRIILGSDTNSENMDKAVAHENYHASQYGDNRMNYDIAHKTDNEQWARMQKRPEMMSTNSVWNNYYDRKPREIDDLINSDINSSEFLKSYHNTVKQGSPSVYNDIIFNTVYDKVNVDKQLYQTPGTSEGEAQRYEDTGIRSYKNGGEMQYYQNGLDFQPKSISKNGAWLDKYDKAQNGDLLDKWRADHPTVRSFINDSQNRKIQSYKGKGKETNVTQKDNTRTVTPKEIKKQKLSGKQQNELALKQSEEQARKDQVFESMQEAYKSPLMSPGYFTPEGATIGALQGATKLGPDLYEGNYKGAAIDALMALPIGIPAAKKLLPRFTTKQNYTLPEPEPFIQLDINNPTAINLERTAKINKNIYKETIKDGNLQINKRGGTPENPKTITIKTKTGNIQAVQNPDGSYMFHNDVGSKIDAGKAMLKLNEHFPSEPNIFETSSMSTDSYTNLLKIGKNKDWVSTHEGFSPLNDANKNVNFLDDLFKWKNRGANAAFPSEKNALEAQRRMTDYLNKHGYNESPNIFEKHGEWQMEIPNFRVKRNYKEGGIIKDDRGQWNHPGEITRISGGNITMKKDPRTGKALTEPLLGIADTGEQQWMYPGEDYNFEGANYVTEIPKRKLAKNGLRQEQKGLVNLDQLTNFTNYNTKQPGGWLDNL